MNINSVERELLFMYVVDYCGFHNVGFNFDLNKRYQIDSYVENEKVIRQLKARYDGLQKPNKQYWNNARFFGENISALTMLIGENGSGKTTFMRLLISWLSLLSVGEEPKEQGLLLFRERIADKDRLFYICFGGLSIKTELNQEKESTVADVKTYLQKVSLVYYTDTMTDSGTGQIGNEEANKYLNDWSLLQRLAKKSIAKNKAQLRRIDFQPQIDLYLSLNKKQRIDFPLHVLKFQYQKFSNNDFSDFDGFELLTETIWTERKKHWGKDWNMIPVLLICDIISGYISHLFMLKPAYGKNWSTIKDRLYRGTQGVKALLLSMSAFNKESVLSLLSSANGFIENISQLILLLCPEERSELEELRGIAINALMSIKDVISTSFFEWFAVADVLVLSEEAIWTTDLSKIPIYRHKKSDINAIRKFFVECDRAYSLMQACWFEWQYPSSGELNYCSLRVVLQTNLLISEKKRNCVWFLCDEPDNAFHPEWKRIVIQLILECCASNNSYVQLWISTHSPILLSDVPKQAAILLNREGENKKIEYSSYSPFAQQLYRMYRDAFFLEDGAIGSFAEHKIDEALEKRNDELHRIIDILDEPLLKGYLKMVLGGGGQK